MVQQETDTKQRILTAAAQIFAAKGKAGARMQEIADLAEANKAMIYYYYTSKDSLYEKVLDAALGEIFGGMARAVVTEAGPEEKVRRIIDAYVEFYIHRQDLFQLLLREIIGGGEALRKTVSRYKDVFEQQPEILPAQVIQQGIDAGTFRPLDPQHTFMSLMGMAIVYAFGRPIIDTMLGIEDAELTSFLEKRRHHIADLLLNGLLVR
jgi:TetR/AcrR family transcriptional regulator